MEGERGEGLHPNSDKLHSKVTGPNSHRPHKWGLGSKPVQGLVGRARPHTGGGRLPGLPAPGRQLWGTAHPRHKPSVDPQNKREGGRRLRPPRVGDAPSPSPYFFSFFFFLLNFISRTAPSLLGTPRNCLALPLLLSRYRYLRPFGVAQSSLHVQFPSLGLFPLPPPAPLSLLFVFASLLLSPRSERLR